MVKISEEKLAALAYPEYTEYRRLVRRHGLIYTFSIILYFLLAYAVAILGIGLLFVALTKPTERLLGAGAGCVGAIGVYAAIAILGVIAEPLHTFFEFIAGFFRGRGRREVLRRHFEPIEREIEVEAIEILSGIEIACNDRIRENEKINASFRYKRKWQDWYEKDLQSVKTNCELNSSAADIVDDHLKYIRFDTRRRNQFTWFRRRLGRPHDAYETLLKKVNSMIGRPDSLVEELPSRAGLGTGSSATSSGDRLRPVPSSINSPNPLGLNTRSDEARGERPKHEAPKKPTSVVPGQKPDRDEVREFVDRVLQATKPTSASTSKGPAESPSAQGILTSRHLSQIVRKAPGHSYRKITKVSGELYDKMAAARRDVGQRGEILALAWEIDRVRKEEGEALVARVEHSSVEVGDGLGFDIKSVKAGQPIFIEVKTTTGDFPSGLFFTRNEYERMLELGEQYFLFRISSLNLETNLGDLFIFEGARNITAHFDFDPTAYVLRQRNP